MDEIETLATPEDYAAAAEAQRAMAAGTPMEARFASAIEALKAGTIAPVMIILRRG